jgi:hypothetical protein
MPEQERRPRRRSNPQDAAAATPGRTDPASSGRSGPGRTAPGPDGSPVPIRDGTPRIRLDGLPSTLRWAIWLLFAEGAGLVALAVFLVVVAFTGTSQSATSAVALVIFTLLMAVFLAGLGYALTRRRRWARGPALVLQLLLLPIGYSNVTSGIKALGIVMIVIGLAGCATLLAPATSAALE